MRFCGNFSGIARKKNWGVELRVINGTGRFLPFWGRSGPVLASVGRVFDAVRRGVASVVSGGLIGGVLWHCLRCWRFRWFGRH